MNGNTRMGVVVLCLTIVLLAGTASAAGVFLSGSGATASAVSVRGERYEYAIDGVYRFNAQRIVAEGVGWDIFTLFFAVPALLVVLPWVAKNSLRGRLFAIGLLGYFFYQYLMYALTWAFGPLFLMFIAIYALSLVGIVWIVSSIEIAGFAARCSARFPRKGMAILSVSLALVLVAMWLQRIVSALGGNLTQGMLLGQTTMVVQGLDLGLIVPLATFTGVMAWRGCGVGYLLSSVMVVKTVAMAAAICAMVLYAWRVEGHLEVVGFAFFASATVIATWLGVRMYRSVA